MKQSQLFFKTRKETPADADSINASYLIRAGLVEKQMAGVYALLPLGYRVYKKIEQIIRQEMNKVGGQEILMNVLQPKELWDETGRWEEGKEVMYQFKDSRDKELGLGWTHEEQLCDIIRKSVKSYKELPLSLYQIQVKFRNEPRAKSGLLRGREFIMKDMYSFHVDEKDLDDYYEKVKASYLKIYQKVGLDAKVVLASGGLFSKYSHEFQVLTPAGEDTIFYCDKCGYAVNKEIAEVAEGDKCPECGGLIKKDNGVEVGNIFKLGKKYSEPMNVNYVDKDGKENQMIMGCYGLGLTRLIGTLVETQYDSTKNKMVWPRDVAPFAAHLISLGKNDEAEEIYQKLIDHNIDVLYDDRESSAGEKFAEADLVGCPIRIIISAKSLEQGGVEISIDNQTEILSTDKIIDKVTERLENREKQT